MKILFTVLLLIGLANLSAEQHFQLKENFQNPRFYNSEVKLWYQDNTTEFVQSLNSGFTWGAYSPAQTTAWSPITYLYNASLSSIRNAMCFMGDSESAGSYAYCQFDAKDSPGVRDSLMGLSAVKVEFIIDGPNDKIGLMIRDAKGEWYYSHEKHGILANKEDISFHVNDFTWMKVSDAISTNLDKHTNISNGLGDIRTGALEASPDLSYITGGGLLLHEGAASTKALRIGSIAWSGKAPVGLAQLSAPLTGSTITDRSTNLQWSYDSDEQVTFNLWLAKADETMAKVAENISAHQYKISDLEDLTNYKWRVDVVTTNEILSGLEWTFAVKEGIPQYFNTLQTTQVNSTPFVKWTNLGPGTSGYCERYVSHPTDPNSMYTHMDMGNSYYTHDNGLSWHTTKDWDSDGEQGNRPAALDFSHQNPDFGLALNDKGQVLKTTDRGSTFAPLGTLPSSKQVSVIAVDPQDDNNWYVGAGQFWRVKSIHRSLADYHGTQYRNTEYGHIYLSKDKGKSWTKITEGFNANMDVAKIFVDPRNSEVVYMYTNYGFYKSTDGGYSWALKGQGLPYNLPRDGAIYYNEDTGEFKLYLLEQTNYSDNGNGSVKASGGVYKSTDDGESWTSILGNLPIDYQQINAPTQLNKYYRALGYWFGITTDEAKRQYPNKPSSIYSVFNRMVVSKENPDEIYLSHNIKHDYAFGPGEIWKTSDGGKNWTVCARVGQYWTDRTDSRYWQSRKNPLGMNMTFAHLDVSLRKHQAIHGIRSFISKSNGELICGYDQQILRSVDRGNTWHQIDDDETRVGSKAWVGRGGSNLPGAGMQLETGMSRYLFCSGEHGLWISEADGDKIKDEGVAVRQISGQVHGPYGPTSISSVAVHPTDTNTMCILMFRQGYRGHVLKTTNAGASWDDISYPLPSSTDISPEDNRIAQKDLQFSKDNPQKMFFCVPFSAYNAYTANKLRRNCPEDLSKFGVFRSSDGGVTWRLANNGLPTGSSVFRLTMAPNNSDLMYASLNRTHNGDAGALYRTENGADLWTKMTIPSVIKSVNHLHIDRTTGALYLSAGEYEGDVDAGGVWLSNDQGRSWKKIFYMPNVKEAYSSNVDPQSIVVNVQMGRKIGNINPGVYYSKDGGQTWTKANYGLGQPSRIHALRIDPKDTNVFWVALFGSGFYRGVLCKGEVRARANNVYVNAGDQVSLDASASFGENLSYSWQAPSAIQLDSNTDELVRFTAPIVAELTELKIQLTVSDGTSEDILDIRIVVRGSHTSAPITQVKNISVNVFPNPVQSHLNVAGLDKNTDFSIFDVQGKEVLSGQVSQQAIDLRSLEKGIYIYTLKGEGQWTRGQFIKK